MSDHTPLPWRVFTNKDGTKVVGIGSQDGEGILDAGFGVWAWNDPEGIENAELVVRSVNALPALVKALEKIAWDAYDEADYAVKHKQPTMIWQSVARTALDAVKDMK